MKSCLSWLPYLEKARCYWQEGVGGIRKCVCVGGGGGGGGGSNINSSGRNGHKASHQSLIDFKISPLNTLKRKTLHLQRQ